MNLDSPSSSPVAESVPAADNPELQVRFKTQGKRLLLLLPPASVQETDPTWSELWEQFKHKLLAGERFWQPHTSVYLVTGDRLLDARQLQDIADALSGVQLNLKRVYTTRRQTAVAAVTVGYSVEQSTPIVTHLNQESSRNQGIPLSDPLYLENTVRSGAEIRHNGSLILLGDVNPGGSVVAAGDILIWGRLKGLAHAGYQGNENCRIMALHLEPTQLRIADKVARPPETPPVTYLPEVAYIKDGGIRIALAPDFARWLNQIPVSKQRTG